MKKILILTATFFNIGHAPIAPGSWASLVTVATLYIINPYLNSAWYVQVIGVLIIFFIGIPAAGFSEKHFGTIDPRPCVIDEVAGQMTALIMVSHSLLYYGAAFLIFRIMDIFKPFPIKRAEKIGGGTGIMLDDLIAGLYSLILVHLIQWLA